MPLLKGDIDLRICVELEHQPEIGELIVQNTDEGFVRMTILADGEHAFETIVLLKCKQAQSLSAMLAAVIAWGRSSE